jgi:hypothetical protein
VQLTAQILASELLVLPDIGRNDPLDAVLGEEQPETNAVDTAVVRHDGQVSGALLE